MNLQTKDVSARRVKIASVGHYVPERVVTSEELEKKLNLPKGWIVKHAGVEERRFADEKQTPSDLAVSASKKALNSIGMPADEIDLIIFTSTCRDMAIPATAAIIHNKLKIKKHLPTLDLNAVCVSFLMGLDIAKQYISSGTYKNVLIVSAELTSRVINWKDKNSCILFGDAAAAVILTTADENEKSNFIYGYFATDSSKWDVITIKGFGLEYHPQMTAENPEINMFKMDGLMAFKATIVVAQLLFGNLIRGSGSSSIDEFDLVVPHQANLPGMRKFMRKAEVPFDKCFINIQKYGNTASTSVPLALSQAVEAGRIKRGDRLILAVVGAGFSWGGISLVY